MLRFVVCGLVNSVGEVVSWLYMLFVLFCIWFTVLLVVCCWIGVVCCWVLVGWFGLLWCVSCLLD